MKKKKFLLIFLGLGLIACHPNTTYNKPSESQISSTETSSSIESIITSNADSLTSYIDSTQESTSISDTLEQNSSEEKITSSSSSIGSVISSERNSSGGLDINSNPSIDSGIWSEPTIVC